MKAAAGLLSHADETLGAAWQACVQALDESRNAPLSARHAVHAAALIDRLSDLAFVRRAQILSPPLSTAGVILSFRATLRVCEPALGPLMDLLSCRANGPCLQIGLTEVAPEGFAKLPIADLMVSLYNAGTVSRLVLVESSGITLPMQDLLHTALDWWRASLGAKVLLPGI